MITTRIFFCAGDYIVCDLNDKVYLRVFSSEERALKYCKEKEKVRKKRELKNTPKDKKSDVVPSHG